MISPDPTHSPFPWPQPGAAAPEHAPAEHLETARTLRHAALLHKVPYYTTLSGAVAAAQGIKAYLEGDLEVHALQNYYGGRD